MYTCILIIITKEEILMNEMYKGYDLERIQKEQEILRLLQNFKEDYGINAVNELIEKAKN